MCWLLRRSGAPGGPHHAPVSPLPTPIAGGNVIGFSLARVSSLHETALITRKQRPCYGQSTASYNTRMPSDLKPCLLPSFPSSTGMHVCCLYHCHAHLFSLCSCYLQLKFKVARTTCRLINTFGHKRLTFNVIISGLTYFCFFREKQP